MQSQQSNLLLSIVIPTWNRENELPRALESLSGIISYSCDVEIIVTDNCSSDKTVEVARIWGKKNEWPIKILESADNLGPVLNWIKGVEYSNGLYTLLLFSDDFIHFADHLEIASFFRELKAASLKNVGIMRLPTTIVDLNLVPSPDPLISLVYDSELEARGFSTYVSPIAFLLNHLLPRRLSFGKCNRTFSPVSPAGYIINRDLLLTTLTRHVHRRSYKTNGAGIDQLCILNAARSSAAVGFLRSPTTVMVASLTSISHNSQASRQARNSLSLSYFNSEFDFAVESLGERPVMMYVLLLFLSIARIVSFNLRTFFGR